MCLLVSNAIFLSALYLLYKLILFISPDECLAERSILYYLVYPSGFIFSCLYSESTFLFFAVASFYAAKKDRWLLAGLLAAALSLTRPIGVAIILPLALIYLDSIHWRWRDMRPDILWLGVAPLAFLGFMLWSAQITGDILGIFTIQSTWDKKFTWPWNTIFHPVWFTPGNTPIDQAAALLFLVLVALSLLKLPSWRYGVYSLLFIASPLFTGQILSMTSYTSVLFPCFIVLAKLGRNETLHKAILVLFFTIQIVFMAAWSRFYWAQ
jgi:hypothetical protein